MLLTSSKNMFQFTLKNCPLSKLARRHYIVLQQKRKCVLSLGKKNTREKNLKRTPWMVLKSLFSLASSNFPLHFGIQFLLTRVSFHYAGLVKCRESTLIALLLQIRHSSEIPGFPLGSCFLTLLHRIKNSFLLLKKGISYL